MSASFPVMTLLVFESFLKKKRSLHTVCNMLKSLVVNTRERTETRLQQIFGDWTSLCQNYDRFTNLGPNLLRQFSFLLGQNLWRKLQVGKIKQISFFLFLFSPTGWETLPADLRDLTVPTWSFTTFSHLALWIIVCLEYWSL